MTRNIDSKYVAMETANLGLQIVNKRNMDVLPGDEPLFLLRGRDWLAMKLLERYLELCEANKCAPEHIAGVRAVLREFQDFADHHPERMKLPD